MVKDEIVKLIKKALTKSQKKLGKFKLQEIKIEYPRDSKFGDYSTNFALQIKNKKNPMEIAQVIVDNFPKNDLLEKIEVKKPGFINFYLSKEYLRNQLKEILDKEKKYGDLNLGKGKKVQVEFISANPTGPLTIGNGRGVSGDVLASVLKKADYKVKREYYINDVGNQTEKLGESMLYMVKMDKNTKAEDLYKRDYLMTLLKIYKDDKKFKEWVDTNDPKYYGKKVIKYILENLIKPTTLKMEIKFDKWFLESDLHKKNEVNKIIEILKKKKLTKKEKDGSLWFLSTKFGDDKDRVLIKKDGAPTYLASDFAYLKNKIERKFDQVINIWGTDHHGYVKRMLAASEALGYKGKLKIIIYQLVRLIKGGKEVKISKRTGTYITLDELLYEVGKDVARFFFLMHSFNTHMDFDLDLAKEKSEKNPVYYVQYAYARLNSILRRANKKTKIESINKMDLDLLNHPAELTLIKHLNKFPELVSEIAQSYSVHRIPYYSISLADRFHNFYEECKVLSDDKNLTAARLKLIQATKIVLKNTLDLMGISAPEKM